MENKKIKSEKTILFENDSGLALGNDFTLLESFKNFNNINIHIGVNEYKKNLKIPTSRIKNNDKLIVYNYFVSSAQRYVHIIFYDEINLKFEINNYGDSNKYILLFVIEGENN